MINFEITGKIGLITGGASGLGLKYAKELLKNGLRGIALADINDNLGATALKEIETEFGSNKAIFIHTDATKKEDLENAFNRTVKHYKNLDILINNAGILNDAQWEKEIALNINGVANGTILALEKYIPQYKTGADGVIVNISSIAGIYPFASLPLYTASKFAVFGMSKAFGSPQHYKRTKVRVLIMCPGVTDTNLFENFDNHGLTQAYADLFEENVKQLPIQSPDYVALGMVQIIKTAENGTAWVVEDEKSPYEFVLPPRENFAPK